MSCLCRRCPATFVAFVGLAAASIAHAAEPAAKNGPVKLIMAQDNSGELAGWQSYNEDPKAKTGDVWRLTADGVLVCRGTPKGYIYTRKDFTDFVLKLQWRRPKDKQPGKGGVLIRTIGKHKIWPKSLEAQLNAPDAGDFWGLDGYPLAGPADRIKTLRHEQFGKLTNLKRAKDAEKPAGQWNQYEIVARGETVTLVINGQVVNRATGCPAVPGKICLTAEGDEIHFRNVQVIPLPRSE